VSAAVGAVAVVAGLSWWYSTYDVRQVRKNCRALAALASVPPGEPDVARLRRAAQFVSYLTPDFVLETPVLGVVVEGRELIATRMARIPPPTGGTTVVLSAVDVTLDEGSRSATARTTASVQEHDAGGRVVTVESRTLTLWWTKIEGGWYLARVLASDTDEVPVRPGW
jgi:hypothetical protein